MLIARLDYELIQRFTLTVIARDGGGEETTGRVRINVLDVNDNVPTFQKDAYVGALRENEPSVTQLVRLRVRCQVTFDLSVSLVLLSLSLCHLLEYPFVKPLQEVLTPIHKGFCSDQGSHSRSVSGPPLSITLHPWLLSKTSVCFGLDFRSPVTIPHLPW